MKEWNPNLPIVALPPKKKRKKKPKPKPRQRGRKKIRRKFEQTTIGYNLKLNAPMEYEMIVEAGGKEPSADLIESISYSSINPYFHSIMFRQLLITYRKYGCYQHIPKGQITAEEQVKFLQVRKKRMKAINLNVR